MRLGIVVAASVLDSGPVMLCKFKIMALFFSLKIDSSTVCDHLHFYIHMYDRTCGLTMSLLLKMYIHVTVKWFSEKNTLSVDATNIQATSYMPSSSL